MSGDFTGPTARLYARCRRDLPAGQARALAERMGLRGDDVVIDLGCGTGQLAAPLQAHCAGVVGLDPEPQMLVELHARGLARVLCVLGDDSDLSAVARTVTGSVGAVVIGNALHLMGEAASLRRCAQLLRRGGAIAVVTQGPPLWLGPARWQVGLRRVLERALGTSSGTCRSDAAALDERIAMLNELGLDVQVATWQAGHEVDADWVIGHLGSALPPGALHDEHAGGLTHALRAVLAEYHDEVMIEDVTTTAVIAHRPT